MHLKLQRTAAFTLVETCIAVGLSGLLVAGVGSFSYYLSRTAASMTNYADLDKQGQLALDKFTQQVRQVQKLTSCGTFNSTITNLTFLDYDGGTLSFTYDPANRTLTRRKDGASEYLLTGCNSCQFQIFQRNVQWGTFDAITTATATNCKLVEVSWNCGRKILGANATTENMQSAKVDIRAK